MTKDEGIIDLVCEIKKKCIENDSRFIADINISDSEYNFIKALINCKSFNSKSIAKKMNISLSRVSRIIDKMVKGGYVTRTNSEEDRRTINISLTSEGKRLVEEVVQFRLSCEKKITTSLTDMECNMVKTILNKIIDSL
ncbi:MAG: MarR family transcriptional regulator [Bacteroidales bacterium]|nr:MarR family transcriptional regulator [Bacteroidales bacterium]